MWNLICDAITSKWKSKSKNAHTVFYLTMAQTIYIEKSEVLMQTFCEIASQSRNRDFSLIIFNK